MEVGVHKAFADRSVLIESAATMKADAAMEDAALHLLPLHQHLLVLKKLDFLDLREMQTPVPGGLSMAQPRVTFPCRESLKQYCVPTGHSWQDMYLVSLPQFLILGFFGSDMTPSPGLHWQHFRARLLLTIQRRRMACLNMMLYKISQSNNNPVQVCKLATNVDVCLLDQVNSLCHHQSPGKFRDSGNRSRDTQQLQVVESPGRLSDRFCVGHHQSLDHQADRPPQKWAQLAELDTGTTYYEHWALYMYK